jgi:hypothetical protein
MLDPAVQFHPAVRSLRRHLASFGLAVALCHLFIQVLVPAALCCQSSAAASRDAFIECCPPGSHPPGLCPLHASAKAKSRDSRNCHARPSADLLDLFVALTSGGVLPAMAAVAAPVGMEAAPAAAAVSFVALSTTPPGPPPRV